MTVRQLSDVVQTEGLATAIRFAVWKAEQRARGRHLVAARRRLLDYYETP